VEKVINKPWGSEVIWAQTDKYVGKLLFIKAGERLSLQYHEHKSESLLVDRGRIKYYWYEEGDPGPCIKVMLPGDHVDVPAGQKHRIEAIDCACVIEVSTPELDDVVRLEDDYNRIE
jgi:mannose-6-phosphate isomerase-like protein (cupin superfamily)